MLSRVLRCSSHSYCYYNYNVCIQVKKLQKQLQEEIDLHLALANAVAHDSMPTFKSPAIIPYKVQLILMWCTLSYKRSLPHPLLFTFSIDPGASSYNCFIGNSSLRFGERA